MIGLLSRVHPSAGHPGGGSDLQRPASQLHRSHKLPHLQRPAVPGEPPHPYRHLGSRSRALWSYGLLLSPQNGGACEDSEASLYRCSCPRGFTGSNCQHHSSLHCHSGTRDVPPPPSGWRSLSAHICLCPPPTWTEACGPDATCINRPNGLGYDCRCHLGKSGNKCMEGKKRRYGTVLVQGGAGRHGWGL